MPEKLKKKLNINLMFFLIGTILFVMGFISLYFVNQNAQNFFGFLSPFLLISGIILIAISFMF